MSIAGGKGDNPGGIPTLARQRLADQIADVLRSQMLTGQLRPGQQLHERETADALGVSRTPLREAMLILEAEGMILTAPARTPIVANPSLEELSEMLVVISALERLAGALACERASDAQIAHIRGLYEKMVAEDAGPDTLAFFRTDMAFHEGIVESTGNRSLIKTHRQYNSRLWRARYISSSMRVGRASTMRDHREIIEGLERRDPTATADVLERHLRKAIKNIALSFSEAEKGAAQES